MAEEEILETTCCFTGHRAGKLTRPEDEIRVDLEQAIVNAIATGYRTFICGMAYGVDLWAAEIVLRLKTVNPDLRLVAAVPYPGFPNHWTADWRARYKSLLSAADQVKVLEPGYRSWAYRSGTSGWLTAAAL